MRRLLLLRHGKAEPAQASSDDFARPLTDHGRAQALQVAHRLKSAHCVPELILASPALRARETALILAARLECLQALHFEPQCYPGKPKALLHLLRHTQARIGTLLLVGHNPGLSDLARQLARFARQGAELAELSTAGLYRIELPAGAWHDIETVEPTSVSLLT
jgi:phosphohistidine phosphatase